MVIVKRLVNMLFDLTPNAYWKIIDWQANNQLLSPFSSSTLDNEDDDRENSDSDDETAEGKRRSLLVKPVAIGVLSTFVFYYGIGRERLPVVYSRAFVVETMVRQAISLLNTAPAK